MQPLIHTDFALTLLQIIIWQIIFYFYVIFVLHSVIGELLHVTNNALHTFIVIMSFKKNLKHRNKLH